ncbi:hypothetical protein CHS0354_011293 [Potamilus streckersoni]|uniref:Uncharacterized protein n=1 Tax=Potamilus streckersoni TaxID=2493646 RepID=A0AAE0VRG8_9BIVA|nr:hypothetical protein CHS0354_011293 [Potamilus streckersoni]
MNVKYNPQQNQRYTLTLELRISFSVILNLDQRYEVNMVLLFSSCFVRLMSPILRNVLAAAMVKTGSRRDKQYKNSALKEKIHSVSRASARHYRKAFLLADTEGNRFPLNSYTYNSDLFKRKMRK